MGYCSYNGGVRWVCCRSIHGVTVRVAIQQGSAEPTHNAKLDRFGRVLIDASGRFWS